MARRLFYCDRHTIPLPPGHKFPMEKYRLLRELLMADGFYKLQPAPFAKSATIELAHDSEYVLRFFDGTIDAGVMRRIGFPWPVGLVVRTLASVGGTVAAAADALATGFGGSLAGGTHHAFRDQGSGFCVFNDIAIAIRHHGRRAAVLDLDVHQGDGTAAIFEDDAEVLTVSLHGANNFPFRKQRSRIDVALADGTGDDEYLSHVRAVLPQVLDFRPEILFFQSGVDGLAGDRLGRLALSHAGLAERDRRVCEFSRMYGIPLAIVLGGGYADPISRTAEAHAGTFRTAAAVFG
jgi:acetoin utilization deacetylase AcuC-like enzyme